MSDRDKMMAFGNWLSERIQATQLELYALSVNAKVPVDALRVKGGHLESLGFVMHAFKELYNGDLNKFMVEYLGQKPEEEEKESTNGSGESP